MQLVGYECRMWMPLDLSPSHNWLVNNLAPVSPGTEPQNSQAAYSSETAILHVTASSCPCSSESLLFSRREGRGRVGSGQRARATHSKKQLNTPALESANSKNLPKFLPPNSSFSFTSGAFEIVVY